MFLLLLLGVHGFYLPGVAPREYSKGDAVDLKVNKLESVETQLPYAYYDLPFCQPENVVLAAENLGEVLTGEVIENSIFQIQMLENEACKVQC
jgi:transmembrane 9 superfamily protein 2/4